MQQLVGAKRGGGLGGRSVYASELAVMRGRCLSLFICLGGTKGSDLWPTFHTSLAEEAENKDGMEDGPALEHRSCCPVRITDHCRAGPGRATEPSTSKNHFMFSKSPELQTKQTIWGKREQHSDQQLYCRWFLRDVSTATTKPRGRWSSRNVVWVPTLVMFVKESLTWGHKDRHLYHAENANKLPGY